MEERVVEEQLRVFWGASQLRTWQCLSLIMGPIEVTQGNTKRKSRKNKTTLRTRKREMKKTKTKTTLRTRKREMKKTKTKERRRVTTTTKRMSKRAPIIGTREEEDLQAFGGLPDCVLMKILALLPVPTLFQVRSVCKSWNSLLRSPAFLQAWSSEAPSECWLVTGRTLCRQQFLGAKEFRAYSPSLGKWFHLPLDPRTNPSISSSLGIFSFRVASGGYLRKYFDVCSASNFVLSSAGGLMCCVINAPIPRTVCDDNILPDAPLDHRRFRVLVFNLLTGAVKMLPPPPYCYCRSSCRIAISMCMDSATHSYHVILSDGPKSFYCMEVYDSKTGCWKVGRPIRWCTEFSGDVLNGDLFFNRGDIIAAYHADTDTWSKVKACPRVGENCTNRAAVFKFKGQLFVAQHCNKCGDGEMPIEITEGFVVYKLQSASGETATWVEVARTPPEFFTHNEEQTRDFNIIGHGNLICMTCVKLGCYREDNKVGEYCPPLVYDLSVDTWYHLPCHTGSHDFLGLFAFEPRLDVMV